jgi:hypothetical protein
MAQVDPPAEVGSNGGLGAWVPTRERMPPPDVWLLVVWGAHKAVDKAHTFNQWKHHAHPLGYLIQGHPGAHVDVTHWMLLPTPPEAPNAGVQPRRQASAGTTG